MPEKTRRLQNQEFSEKCYFRWEFIRRNPIYCSDYQDFVSTFSRWFEDRGFNLEEIHGWWSAWSWDDFFDRVGSDGERYYVDEMLPYVEAFHQKWGVAWPCNPAYSFERNRLDEESQGYDPSFLDQYCDTPVVGLYGDLSSEIALSSLISTSSPKFDLATLVEMAEQVEKKVMKENRREQLRRSGRSGPPRAKGSPRVRLREYGLYLEVWDFIVKCPEAKWHQVAAALYPQEYARCRDRTQPGSTNTVVQRVKDHYRRAKELINGDFVEIR